MPGSVSVSLDFLKRLELYDSEKPYQLFVGQPTASPDIAFTNVETGAVSGIPLRDARGEEELYCLDVQGFQFVKHQQSFSDFENFESVERDYVPEVEKIIYDNLEYAEKVIVFDWRIRKQIDETDRDPNMLVSPAEIQQQTFALAPSRTVHADATEYTLLKRVRKHLGDEAEELLKGRVQMINFWRPIEHPIHNWPLILCDGRTSPIESLVAVDQVGRRFVGDIYYAPYSPSFKWHYLSNMSAQEGVMFKNWDTSTSSPSRLCLHTSCALPAEAVPHPHYPRHSIESRALVFSSE